MGEKNLPSQIHKSTHLREADGTIIQNNHKEDMIIQTSWWASGCRELAEVKHPLYKQ